MQGSTAGRSSCGSSDSCGQRSLRCCSIYWAPAWRRRSGFPTSWPLPRSARSSRRGPRRRPRRQAAGRQGLCRLAPARRRVPDFRRGQHARLFQQAHRRAGRAGQRRPHRRGQAGRAPRTHRPHRHPPGQGGPFHQRLRRPQFRRLPSPPRRAAAGGHHQRRDRHADGDRRQHHALGHRRGARPRHRQDRRARPAGRAGRRARRRRIARHAAELAGPARRRRGAQPEAHARGRQPGLPRIRARRRRRGRRRQRQCRHLHRPVRRAGERAGHRPQPAGRHRMAAPEGKTQARPAGHAGGGQRRVFVQGLGLRARRHLRPHRGDPGRKQLPLSRPQPPTAGRRGRRRRAGVSRSGAVHRARRRRARPGRALAPAAHGAARAQREGQGVRHLRPALRTAAGLHQARRRRATRGAGRGRSRPGRAGRRRTRARAVEAESGAASPARWPC